MIHSLSRIITDETDLKMKSDKVAAVIHEHYKQKINSKKQKINEANNQLEMYIRFDLTFFNINFACL